MATVIISLLLIATIVGAWLVGATLIRNIKRTSTSSGNGAPTPPSSSSTSSSPAPASGGRNWQMPTWIGPLFLTIAGLWLILRVLAFKGAPDNLEAVLAVTIALIGAFLVKKERRFAGFFLSGLIIVLVLFPGIMTWLQEIRQAQINPPAPVEQVAPTPPVEEEEISKEPILPRSNNAILLKRSGYYNTIKGKYRLCFSWLGDEEDGGSRINQSLKINDVEFNSRGSNCYQYESEGKIYVEFINPTQTPNDSYSYYRKRVGGQGVYPFLEPVQ
jgi:hypothetical protein